MPGAAWWRSFLPGRTRINSKERWRIVAGSFFGILLTALVGHLAVRYSGLTSPWLLAPMGASAVLVFAVPASPMAQPWPVIGGNTLCALAGIAGVQGAHWLGFPEVAAALAVATAILLMLMFRCLHPPGGATALMMVLGGVTAYETAFYPAMLNAVFLVVAGVLFNNATGRPYPHRQLAEKKPSGIASESDLDAVLEKYNQVLDVSRDDLQRLVEELRLRAYDRKIANVHCEDIMSRNLVSVGFDTTLEQAWALLRERRVKALPVVDKNLCLVGIITLADFLRVADLALYDGFEKKIKDLVRTTRKLYSSKPEVVGHIMTRHVRVMARGRPVAELLPLFASTGHHHIPIIGEGERLVGMITQSDLVAILGRVADPEQ